MNFRFLNCHIFIEESGYILISNMEHLVAILKTILSLQYMFNVSQVTVLVSIQGWDFLVQNIFCQSVVNRE